MSSDTEHVDWPTEAGDPRRLERERDPPPELEDRVVAALHRRGLLTGEPRTDGAGPGWRHVRLALAMAAGLLLFAGGAWVGRNTAPAAPVPAAALTGSATDLYALLLYETEGYDRPRGAAFRSRYDEYSQWVAEAVRRDQFVAGEDLLVESGWALAPAAGEPMPAAPARIDAAPPLSGIFFIRADSPDEALELAGRLPHLRHGGTVVVQKTVPTDTPPEA